MAQQEQRYIGRYVVVLLLSMIWFVNSTAHWGWQLVNAGMLIAGVFAMRLRHRHPVALTVVLALLFPVFSVLQIVLCWSYLSLSTHRRWAATGVLGLVVTASLTIENVRSNLLGPEPAMVPDDADYGSPLGIKWVVALTLLVVSLLVATLAAVGSYVGARRDENKALQERLEAVELQQALVESESRAQERSRIAREMHDVLAHKLTLIKMHAGVLGYRQDLSPDEVGEAARTIEESAGQALTELRVILGQLRQTEGDGVAAPQPTLDDLGSLIKDHRRAGVEVSFEQHIDGHPSATISRQAYRILQESLTNAAKHAPGTSVSVKVSGKEATGLDMEIHNPLSVAGARGEGSRVGLIGLDERARAVGGQLTAGPDGEGNFVVKVWLPW